MDLTPGSAPLTCTINGARVPLDAAAGTTLLDVVRARGLTGAKEGCAEGECGACAVAMVVTDEQGRTVYRVVNSCLIGLPLAAGHEIYTVESLADGGEPCEAQQAMAAAGGSQCGYCTPGFVMSLFAEQHRRDRVGRCDPLALAGNLCRCTGYRPIRDAALALGFPPPSALRDRLDRPAPRPAELAIDGFSRPATLEACLKTLAEDVDATLVAGNTDLGVEANLRGRRFTRLISLELIPELHEFAETERSILIGASLPLTDIERQWLGAPAFFREWLSLFASPLIRNRATLGGNLATASPIGDLAPLLLTLDAQLHVAHAARRRVVPIEGFFADYRRTVLRPDELLIAVEIPKPLPERVCFYKIAKRRMDDISTVAAAMAIDRSADGVVRRARFAFGGVAATPVRVADAEAAALGETWDEAAVERVQGALQRRLAPLSDHRGSSAYRLEVSKSLVRKFWWEGRR
jgi:xanthine dehydrogenase small subunit